MEIRSINFAARKRQFSDTPICLDTIDILKLFFLIIMSNIIHRVIHVEVEKLFLNSGCEV